MKNVLFATLFFNIFVVYAETNYQYLEEYKKQTPAIDIKIMIDTFNRSTVSFPATHIFLRNIANYINGSSNNEYEKIKKIHDFVSLYLEYDHEAYEASIRPFFAKKLPDQDVNSVILSRKAVCSGYSIMFKTLCDTVGIECYYISGYARSGKWNPYKKEKQNDKKYQHAWNIVRVQGIAYIVDCTWDSSDLVNGYYKAYSSQWLFVKPEHFIYTHFPRNPLYQLLKQPISFYNFTNIPLLMPDCFDYIKIENLTKSKIIYATKDKAFNVYINDGDVVTFTLLSKTGNKKLNEIKTNYMNGGHSIINFNYWHTGKYRLRISYYNTNNNKSFTIGYFGYKIENYEDDFYFATAGK